MTLVTDWLMLGPDDVHVAVYLVIGAPPVDAGAENVTVRLRSPPTTVGWGGAPGTPRGMTDAEGDEAGPGPTPLEATTVHV